VDLIELVLAEHDRQRRGFAVLDEAQAANAPNETLEAIWEKLAVLLDAHAGAEERIFYPRLLDVGDDGENETKDAIGDHNDIRDAVRAAGTHRVGTKVWWSCVADARVANSDHMGEEERGALADFRRRAPLELRRQLGLEFAAYGASGVSASEIDGTDKDPDAYIEEHHS
jgi:hypothetical protein